MLIVLMLVATLVPVRGVAQDDGTPVAELPPAEVPEEPVEPAEIVVEPVADEPVADEPVLDEPAAETESEVPAAPDPVIEVEEPASEPEGEVTEPSTEAPKNDSATEPESEPVVILENTDSVLIASGVTSYTLNQGESVTIPVTYSVTTPRTSTMVAAELVDAPDGWTVSAVGFADANGSPVVGSWVETATLEAGTSFTLSITITAPATVQADHSVGLRVWSTAAGVNGEETGVAWSDAPVASVAVTASQSFAPQLVAPTSLGTCSPVGLDWDVNGVVTLDSGQKVEFSCSFSGSPGKLSVDVSAFSTGWTFSLNSSDDAAFARELPSQGAEPKSPFSLWVKAPVTTEGSEASLGIKVLQTGSGTILLDNALKTRVLPDPVAGDLTLLCEPTSVTTEPGSPMQVTCTFTSKAKKPVTVIDIGVSVPQGWSAESSETGVVVGGQQLTISTGPTLSPGASASFTFELVPVACDASGSVASVTTFFTFDKAPQPLAIPSVDIGTALLRSNLPPALFLSGPVDFGTLTWDGETWGVAHQTTTLTVNREEVCGATRSYGLQIDISSIHDGLLPEFTGATAPEGSKIAVPSDVQYLAESVFASIPAGYSGETVLDLSFRLAPTNEAMPDIYTEGMTITITTVNGQ